MRPPRNIIMCNAPRLVIFNNELICVFPPYCVLIFQKLHVVVSYSYMYLCLCFLNLHYATQLMVHFHIEDSLLILHQITSIEINLEITLERNEVDTFGNSKFGMYWIQKDVQDSKQQLVKFPNSNMMCKRKGVLYLCIPGPFLLFQANDIILNAFRQQDSLDRTDIGNSHASTISVVTKHVMLAWLVQT